MPHRLNSHSCFLDKSFQEDQTEIYVLSIMYSSNGISFTLFNFPQNKFIGFCSVPFSEKEELTFDQKIESALNSYPWLTGPFKQIHFLTASPFSTLVPLPLFEESKARTYLEFNHPNRVENTVLFDTLSHIQSANIYFIHDNVYKKVMKLWPEVSIHHFTSYLLEILAINFKNLTDENQVFVNVSGQRFDLVYFNQGKLIYHNSFLYKTKEDFIYFILSAFEQLSINPEEAKVILLGEINKEGLLYDIVYRYIRHVEFIAQNEQYSYSHVLDELMPHYYFVLFNSLQCEL